MTDIASKSPTAIDDFLGSWELARVIDDALSGRRSHFEGTATIRDAGVDCFYEETGTLHPPSGPPLHATRRYVWAGRSNEIHISFEDGRPFHTISLVQAKPEDRHDCAPDLYHVTYDFAHWPEWSSRWAVSGPRKNYVMTTRYKRTAQ